jgi:hypothetical protein
MKKFIKSQIDSFDKKKYKKSDLLKSNIIEDYPMLFKIEIKNNKMIYDTKIVQNVFINIKEGIDRKERLINILQKMLDKYKVKDTVLLLSYVDGYFWKKDIPVFNYAVPIGKKGLIFPNFDILDFKEDGKLYDFDEIKNKIENYPNEKIKDDIFFRGGITSKNRSKIREKIQFENNPFNVRLIKPEIFNSSKRFLLLFKLALNESRLVEIETISSFKNHKYLLDLPGVKPWSVRLKYLFLMNSPIFRISFYNSKNDEKGYFQQSFDYLFKENKDYVHLIYDFNYDEEIPQNIYIKCVNDIKNKYSYYENNNTEYKKVVNNMKKASKNLNLDEMLKYLHTLIETYTEKLLI